MIPPMIAEWDFSGDEFFFLLLAGTIAAVGAVKWYRPIVGATMIGRRALSRWALALTPIALLLFLWAVLQTLADPVYVAGHLDYMLLFTLGGAMWLWASSWCFPFFGVHPRDDVLERDNRAAAALVCGALAGLMLTYAQSNIGNGPTIWTTIFPAFVGSAALFAAWGIVERFTRVSEQIAIDRDLAAGVRMAGFLIAIGAIFGRAMAGDWETWEGTFADFSALAWPAVFFIPAMIVWNGFMRPTPENPAPPAMTSGLLPAIAMCAAAGLYLVVLGVPEVKPAASAEHPVEAMSFLEKQHAR
jgi:uncharacterized membrane protein YjfL (UPF0719 family)